MQRHGPWHKDHGGNNTANQLKTIKNIFVGVGEGVRGTCAQRGHRRRPKIDCFKLSFSSKSRNEMNVHCRWSEVSISFNLQCIKNSDFQLKKKLEKFISTMSK